MSRNGSGVYNLPTNSWNPAIVGVSATPADWQALINDVAAALTQSLSADGQTPLSGNLNMAGNKLTGLAAGTATGQSLRWEQLFSQGLQQDVAAATTTDIGAQLSTLINVTGSSTINSFGTNYNGPRFLRFEGVCALTNSATLVLPGGANITTAAGDSCIAVPLGNPATGWRVAVYEKADGTQANRILGRITAGSGPVEELTGAQAQSLQPIQQTRVDVASAATVNLTTGAANTDHVNITGTTTITGFTVAAGRLVFVRFAGALTLTNNASIVTQTGANILTQAGDTCILRATAANTVEVLAYREGRWAAVEGTAPMYACRAWANFNGTGTVAIRASGNVSSITDNGTGDYTVNFTTAMPDANYVAAGQSQGLVIYQGTGSTSSYRIQTYTFAGALADYTVVSVEFFR